MEIIPDRRKPDGLIKQAHEGKLCLGQKCVKSHFYRSHLTLFPKKLLKIRIRLESSNQLQIISLKTAMHVFSEAGL
jgi:hypothetical protein